MSESGFGRVGLFKYQSYQIHLNCLNYKVISKLHPPFELVLYLTATLSSQVQRCHESMFLQKVVQLFQYYSSLKGNNAGVVVHMFYLGAVISFLFTGLRTVVCCCKLHNKMHSGSIFIQTSQKIYKSIVSALYFHCKYAHWEECESVFRCAFSS